MVPDDVFRWILLLVFAAFLPVAAHYRVRSQRTGEKLDRWQEGAFILFGLRLSGIPALVGFIAWMIRPDWMAWSALPLPLWLRGIGLALIALWGVLLVWTFRTLGPNLTDTVVTRKNHTLVTTGPYRYVRHPFYLAYAIAVAGGSLVTSNWFLFLAGALPFCFLVARTSIEEKNLVARFGDEYREYMTKTGRFLPRLTRRRASGRAVRRSGGGTRI